MARFGKAFEMKTWAEEPAAPCAIAVEDDGEMDASGRGSRRVRAVNQKRASVLPPFVLGVLMTMMLLALGWSKRRRRRNPKPVRFGS